MQPLPVRTHDTSNVDRADQQPSTSNAASTTSVFQPYKPPLRERELVQTVIWTVMILLGGIGFAAVTMWMFLPSMLPKFPLTFL